MEARLRAIASATEIGLATECQRSLRSAAWDQLWHRYHKLAFWEIQGVLPNAPEDIVDDLVIETYRRLVGQIHNFDPARGRLSTFILRVARSAALDYRKQQSRRPKEDGLGPATPDPHASARESMPLDMASRLLREQLAAPERPDERQVFEAMFTGLTNAEIVERYGISEKIVRRVRRTTLERALTVLNQILPEP